ncbi:hypothetical protein TRV_03142 [Trichophyton verrucosum HKI 0517]|uniref:DUF2828 domain protein n=1 Tax=Trichophyton verrucosum (strain HKI 0517) TaxID=663202 RepID=D4D7Q8_TRIVH|nr:uncharacterized protein TRV_03142 [Trichophyton verrucosum HKI 0517]EFE42142.1 hypothetical protein TRV_03142 [Trichophyton verrucosum HKI 0517]
MEGQKTKTTSMDSSFPVLLPEDPTLHLEPAEFRKRIFASVAKEAKGKENSKTTDSNSALFAQTVPKATEAISAAQSSHDSSGNAFVDALVQEARNPGTQKVSLEELEAKNLAHTDNAGVTHASTESHLVDLFHTLDGEPNEEKLAILEPLLEKAWADDALVTLKIIWNCRSIHLGKGERSMFYVALGWLKNNHPQTLLTNLPWITRGVIEKTPVVIENQTLGVDDYEVVHGVSHGYWKDLLNLLALSANDQLGMKNPESVLKNRTKAPQETLEKLDIELPLRAKKIKVSAMDVNEKRAYLEIPREDRMKETHKIISVQREASKKRKRARETSHHEKLWKKFESDSFHRALHNTIARMFADQLRKDKILLEGGSKQQMKEISLCAKWAPSLERFHDKQTLIATTIAELLFPAEDIKKEGDTRETYLKRAREQYRASFLSPLRKALQVVERDISANNFTNLKYAQVPSLAMDLYKKLFAKKDHDNFLKYLLDVQAGKQTISGSVLMPGPLVHQWIHSRNDEIARLTLNSQWETLIQRIKDSGSLSDSIAVCDVSGSMMSLPVNGATMYENAIGLSLVLSTVTKAPFGGKMITFSESPRIVTINKDGNKSSFVEQVDKVQNMPAGFNTDFLAVFTKAILPLAIKNEVKPEDMVKRVFVFSDMQFDEARGNSDPWATHYQIIEKEYKAAGYEVPELIFWDLSQRKTGSAPVTQDIPGTALVGGQSQAMLKVFLEGGSFDDGEAEEEDEVEGEGEGSDGFEVIQKKKKAITPLSLVMKAIKHQAYDMLKVVD